MTQTEFTQSVAIALLQAHASQADGAPAYTRKLCQSVMGSEPPPPETVERLGWYAEAHGRIAAAQAEAFVRGFNREQNTLTLA